MKDNTGIIWPAFLPNQILVGNPKSNVAIVCGWTKRQFMQKRLEAVDPGIMDKLAGIGQMYTAERGVDMLIRNLLANPRIDTVIFCGKDKSGATGEAEHFLNAGRRLEQDETSSGAKYTRTDDGDRVRVWGDIPVEVISKLRERINWIRPLDRRDQEVDDGLIVETIHHHFAPKGPNDLTDEVCVYEPPKPDVELFPAPNSVQVLRAKTVADGWLELLHYIMTYGKRVPTHYDQDTLEIMDLVMVITEQPARFNPDKPENLPEFMPFMADHMNQYISALMSPEKDPDVTYTYGNLIRAHFGRDQFLDTAQKLAKDRDTRSAVISLWDVQNKMKGSPCLNHIWFRILEGKLNMTATIRSNDMFQGWPENAYGLRRMQIHMRDMILKYEGEFQSDEGGRHQMEMGDLVIVSQSAHIYEDCWGPAKEIVAKHRKYKEWWDEKGQWIFTPSLPGRCKAVLMARSGEILEEIHGSSTIVRAEIAKRGLVSDIGHALYVGQMIERAAQGKEIP